MSRAKSHLLALSIVAGSLSSVAPALAQAENPATRAAAQVLFDDAQDLLRQGEFAKACAKLEEVVKLQPGKIGAMMELAACYEAWGKTASAWARYRTASDLATKASDVRKADADAKVTALEPKVSRLVVLVPESMKWLGGLVIERDGVPLGAATWGAGMPIDPGTHEVTATAPGKKKWATKVEVTRPGTSLTVTVPELDDAPKGAQAGEGMPTVRTAGFVVGGLGLVGVAIGAVFGAQAAGKQSEANKPGNCDEDSCTTQGHQIEQQAFANAAVSTGAFIAGGALLAGGLTMVLWPASKPAASTTARLVVGPGGLSIRGAW